MTDENRPKRGWQPGDDPWAAPQEVSHEQGFEQPVQGTSEESVDATVNTQQQEGEREQQTTYTSAVEPLPVDAKPVQATSDEAAPIEATSFEATSVEEGPVAAIPVDAQAAETRPVEDAQPQVEVNVSVQVNDGAWSKEPPVDPANVVYEKGCCGAAWADVRATKGWFRKVCLMALVEFVPILNWVNQGFAMRWGRQLFLGKVRGMPQKLFCKRAFTNGAMSFVVALVAGIVTGIGSLILDFVPLLGTLVSVAFTLFITTIVNFCIARMAIFDELGEGFALNKAFECLTRDFGKALCVELVPSIVLGCIIACILGATVAVFMVVGGFPIAEQVNNIIGQYSSYRAFEYALETDLQLQMKIASIVLTNFATCVPWILVGGFLMNICNMLITLIKTRAACHFVTRYCSNWSDEPKFYTVMQCEEPDVSEGATF